MPLETHWFARHVSPLTSTAYTHSSDRARWQSTRQLTCQFGPAVPPGRFLRKASAHSDARLAHRRYWQRTVLQSVAALRHPLFGVNSHVDGPPCLTHFECGHTTGIMSARTLVERADVYGPTPVVTGITALETHTTAINSPKKRIAYRIVCLMAASLVSPGTHFRSTRRENVSRGPAAPPATDPRPLQGHPLMACVSQSSPTRKSLGS